MAILSGVIRAMLLLWMNCSYCKTRLPRLFSVYLVFYSSTEALEELCWPTLFKLRLFHRCVFVYKYVNGIIDFKFDTKLISDIHSYNTRGKSNFYLPRVRRNYGKQRFLYQGLGEWNSLDKSIRDMRSLLIFKQALKTAIF